MSGAHIDVPVTTAKMADCGAHSLVRRVGERWTVLIIALLAKRTFRFNELHRAVEGLSQRMLTRTLRSLERDGLVSRTVHPTVPPTVEYALTDLGREFYDFVEPMALWAVHRKDDVRAARLRFDAAP
jgi:DNA-binding HxlR family transcriptional regulator